MTTTTLALQGMSCAACANNVETVIRQVPGVINAQVNFATEQARIDYDEGNTSVAIITTIVAEAGYGATEIRELDSLTINQQTDGSKLLPRVVVSGLVGIVLIFGTLPTMLGLHIPGWPTILHNAWATV